MTARRAVARQLIAAAIKESGGYLRRRYKIVRLPFHRRVQAIVGDVAAPKSRRGENP